MRWISGLGLVATVALASSAVVAQDFSAGKTPAQLFGSDCSACHRTPRGLAGTRDVRTLAAFLRQHYTTNPESAGALAAYVSGFAGSTSPRLGPAAGTRR
jgi:mono/diheme cytochrome c family protein